MARASTSERVTPSTVDEVAAALQSVTSTGDVVALTSGGRAHGGTVISLERLNTVHVDSAGGTLTAGAGAAMKAVIASAQKGDCELVGLASDSRSEHVGALIARGEVARRGICGIEAVLSDGSIVKAGGTVQKDVAAYDIAGVLLGSMGRLAAITHVTFRLAPAGAGLPVHAARGEVATVALAGVQTAFDTTGTLSRG